MSSIIDSGHPEFAIAIRGYDRAQVDDYVQRLVQMLEEAEDRARHAESELEHSAHASVGPRLSEIFDLAIAEARELRANAQRESRELIAAARSSAAELVEEAQAKAQRITAEARAEHEEMLADFERQRELAQRSLEELEDRRAGVLGELRRLHEALGAAAGVAGPPMLETSTTEVVRAQVA